MSFQVGIGSLGRSVFFQAGRCTLLPTMKMIRENFKRYRRVPTMVLDAIQPRENM